MTERMTERKVAILFPGQGAFDALALTLSYRQHYQVVRTFEEIDTVSTEKFSRSITSILFSDHPPDLGELLADEPWVSQLAIYGADVAAFRVLFDHGLRADILAGHSLGEIAALACSGAFSIADGARIAATRAQVIHDQNLGDGRMAALSVGFRRAQAIIDSIDDPLLTVAAENHDEQVIISGPRPAIGRALAIAGTLQISAVELNSPFPFHSPIMEPARSAFVDQIKHLDQHPPTIPVYSPILERYYQADDWLPELLAEHLVRPVRFGAAVRRLHAEGVRYFVESGGMPTLSKTVEKLLADGQDISAWPTLSVDRAHHLALDSTLISLRSADLLAAGPDGSLGMIFAPGTSKEVFAEFWSVYGPEIVGFAQTKLAEFGHRQIAAVSPLANSPTTADTAAVALSTSADTTAPISTADDTAARPNRNSIAAHIQAIYAARLEYPEEVFSDDVLLEAELGIDSIKQIELLTRVSEEYGIPPSDDNVRLTDYDTMGKIVGFILDKLQDQAARSAAAA